MKETSVISKLRRPSSIGLAGVMVFFGAVMLLAIGNSGAVSVLDEATHADYAYQITQGDLPYPGSTMDPEILREWSCRGTTTSGARLPPCVGISPASSYPAGGQNYNFFHPPLYYAITAVMAEVIDTVRPGPTDFIGNARIVSVLWMWAGMLVMFAAIRRLGLAAWWGVAAAAGIPLIPGLAGAATMVSNDAPAALSGALALWALARILKDENYGWFLPAVLAGFSAGTKALNGLPFIALGLLCLLLAVRAWRSDNRVRARQAAIAGVAIGSAVAIVYLGWSLFQAGRGDPNWVNPISSISSRPVVGLPFGELLLPIFGAFGGSLSGFRDFAAGVTPSFGITGYGYWSRLLGWALLAVPLALITITKRGSTARILAVIALALEFAYPHVVEIVTIVSSDRYLPVISKRYGLSILPLLIGCLIVLAERRNARKTLVGFELIGASATVALVLAVAV